MVDSWVFGEVGGRVGIKALVPTIEVTSALQAEGLPVLLHGHSSCLTFLSGLAEAAVWKGLPPHWHLNSALTMAEGEGEACSHCFCSLVTSGQGCSTEE